MDIIVGSRGSLLARLQVDEVARELSKVCPGVCLVPVWVVTSGDVDRSTPMWQVRQTDFFTKEIDLRQLNGEFRLGIHSAKKTDLEKIILRNPNIGLIILKNMSGKVLHS